MFRLRPHDVLLSTLLRMRSSPLMQMDMMTRIRSKFLNIHCINFVPLNKVIYVNSVFTLCDDSSVITCLRKRRSRSKSRSPSSRKRRSKSKDKKKGKKRSRSRERKRSRSRERHRSQSRSKDRSGRYKARKSPMYVTHVKLTIFTQSALY